MKLLKSLVLLAALGAAPAVAQARANAADDDVLVPSQTLCRVGAFRSPSGDLVALTYWSGGYRYVFMDGRQGQVGDANPLVICTRRGVDVKLANGTIEEWIEVPLRRTRTRFESEGATLSGLLIEPVGVKEKPPLAVFVHGSNRNGWINGGYHEPYLYAASGVSSFFFDKRGTGESAGEYHQNFRVLAKDIVAGAEEARRLAKGRYSRIGLIGLSQGGWVGPLAAGPSRADFMVVAFGGVFSPLEEDYEQVALEVRQAGYDGKAVSQAREVAEAAGEIVASRYTSGFERLAEVKREFGEQPWFRVVKGEFTGEVLGLSEAELRARAGKPDPLDLDYRFDSRPVLRELDLPILWVLAEDDRESPFALSAGRITELQKAGETITFYSFPATDHGMIEFTESADGTRTPLRYTEGYHRLVADWIKGVDAPPYGRGRKSAP